MVDKGDLELLLAEITSECERLEARLQNAEDAFQAARQKRATLQGALDIYREHYRLPASAARSDEALRQKLAGKTIKQMVLTLARETDPPMFRVVDMNRRLVQAGMFKDEAAAAASVYSTLGRNRKTFIKVAKGRYMVNPETQTAQGKPNQGTATTRTDGLGEKVASILEEHPDWSRRQMVVELQRQGWDFGGSKPIFAVGACYMRLKRGKSNSANYRQPALRSVS